MLAQAYTEITEIYEKIKLKKYTLYRSFMVRLVFSVT